ncbi:MAG: VanW family protein [Candidatus Desulforudis sp.]|nr:VanW family protein [Desulforudis sp.]
MRKRTNRLVLPLLLLIFCLVTAGTAEAAVMMPLRPVLEREGVGVGWDGEAATARHWDGRLLRVIPGSAVAYLDGREIPLKAPAVKLAGMVFVPSTLFESFLGTLDPVYPAPAFTQVRAGECSWFLGWDDGAWGYRFQPLEITTLNADGTPCEPEADRVWLLPPGDETILNDFLSRVETELKAVGYALAPGAGAALRNAVTAGLESVSLPVERRLGFCEVRFNPGGSNHNNMLNAVKAAEYLNGTVLAPKQVFSYNATVGPRTAERDFVVGYAISGGRHVPARGGGVCRTSTVLYGAVLDAGLTVVERHAHSLPVGYVPVGRDATVSYGTADLKFRNNRPYPVWIEAGGTVHRLQVALWEMLP